MRSRRGSAMERWPFVIKGTTRPTSTARRSQAILRRHHRRRSAGHAARRTAARSVRGGRARVRGRGRGHLRRASRGAGGVLMRRTTALPYAVLIAVWAVSLFLWMTPGYVKPDGAGYVAYLPSAFIDHDLLLFDEWARLGMIRGDAIAFT